MQMHHATIAGVDCFFHEAIVFENTQRLGDCTLGQPKEFGDSDRGVAISIAPTQVVERLHLDWLHTTRKSGLANASADQVGDPLHIFVHLIGIQWLIASIDYSPGIRPSI